MRIKFQKGKQREFLLEILKKTDCPSIKELSNRMQLSCSTLKNYFNESRNLPKNLFEDLCFVGKISIRKFNIEILEDSWGQIKGGRIRKL
jgi:hypothetical protein